jgi:hypothetical protein
MTADAGRDPGDLYAVPQTEHGRRISPTVISQYVRLDQCRRYLRLALHERAAGAGFLTDYGVAPQAILPLLTRSGAEFEEKVAAAAGRQFPTRNLAQERKERQRDRDNDEVVGAARDLAAGGVLLLFQPRLRVALDGWDFTGDADIVRLERGDTSPLHLLVADMKATTTSKVEHRLQVAFYKEMLQRLLADAGIADVVLEMGILYRGTPATDEPADAADAARLAAERTLATRLFGIEDAQLELTPDPEAYADAARGLVLGPASVAARVCDTPFAAIPWHLTYRCDGCLYNELCMKWAAAHDDLSLLPHLTEHDKTGLSNAGIATTRALAGLLEPAIDAATGQPDLRHLRAAPGQEQAARRVARTWPVGPRLDELVHRARRYRGWRGDTIGWLPYIPSKGYGSLPYSDAEHNPNLVRIFIDAQHDYLLDRLYLIGSLVVANERGAPAPERRCTIVEMTPGPPEEVTERDMLVRWIDGTIRALAAVAAPDDEGMPTAPIHLIFYNGFEQRLLLQALSRHAREILAATPLYDFMTQLAGFDSPIATYLDQEIREHKNYPIVCQSLQAVAATARPGGVWFDWNEPAPYREVFRERMFDALGKFDALAGDDGEKIPWSTRRSRFNSQIPLEYAYAAWGALPDAPAGEPDPYQPYRAATLPLIAQFHGRRLEALEHVANDFPGNRDTTKTNFVIPDLTQFNGKAPGLAAALQEFVTIERHVELAAWKAVRLAPPERRVLAGNTLIVRYREADQPPGLVETVAENTRRADLREKWKQEYFEAHPDATRVYLTKEQRALTEPLPLESPFRLRLDVQECGVSLDDALALATLKDGDRVVVEPRWTFDTRLPAEEQKPLTPTPKQLLYGMRMEIETIEVERDGEGNATEAWLRLAPRPTFGGRSSPPGFLFPGYLTPFEEGERYTVDPDPNDIYGFWGAKVVEGLLAGSRNTLFSRVRDGGAGAVNWPERAKAGQARFMAGLEAMHQAGLGNSFEPSKVAYIGESGDAPLLLVQGPPGTGKSYTTAFAVLARLQGALAAGMPCRMVMGAKTHAATDVLMENVLKGRESLAQIRGQAPALFAAFFDERLLAVPIYRVQPRGDVPAGVTPLRTGERRPADQQKVMDLLAGLTTAIVAATPGGVYSAARDGPGDLFAHQLVELLVLDEASQLSLPESIMAALPLNADGQIVIVGDHRQMAPIVKHDWENETRRTFQEYAVYRSLFDTVLQGQHRLIQFEQSFRLDRDMAEFLRRTIYSRDGLSLHSARDGRLRFASHADDFVTAALDPAYPLVVIVHDEASSQLRNDFERDLAAPLLAALHEAGYRVKDGFGLVVPHRAQRANLQDALRQALPGAENPDEVALAVDTVERFQGGERDAIIVSATESDPAYLLAAGKFLYDPRRLTVAISRAKDKMILIAGRSVFSLFSPDEETFANAQLWKDLWHRTCTISLWSGDISDRHVEVWGNPPLVETQG